MFLRKRYNLTNLIATYDEFRQGKIYTTGSTVWYSSTDDSGSSYNTFLYQPTGTTTSLPSTANWQIVEPRSPAILDWMVTISLYKLHERVSPDNIPTHRKDAYDQVSNLCPPNHPYLKALSAEDKQRIDRLI